MDLFRQDRLAGTLLGVAANDALDGNGVATVQSGIAAAALATASASPEQTATAFRGALVGWSLRHPWTADADTLHAAGCIALGLRRSGTLSPTSGAAARAAIVGASMPYDVDERLAVGRALAEVTHADPRSVDAALFVAEVAAACVVAPANGDRSSFVERARWVVRSPELVVALHFALELVEKKVTMDLAVRELGIGNDATEAVPLAAFAFMRFGDSLDVAMEQFAPAAGSQGRAARALLGAWIGTLSGAACLPWGRVGRLREGPFGPTRLRELAAMLATRADDPEPAHEPRAAGPSICSVLPMEPRGSRRFGVSGLVYPAAGTAAARTSRRDRGDVRYRK
ncbi:ADP-ribosylglycohydrolase family protein [Pendulispora rubella]|uniref:ADP-ribosylglycohydrolase family protein n=1 Tax=Pendulispora rubella TaxID=2741070 RepID=A0ABZ2KZX8_9BACT